jgi:hypothetical protein
VDGFQDYDQQGADGAEEQRRQPPSEPATAFALRQGRVDERERKPADRILARGLNRIHLSVNLPLLRVEIRTLRG